MMIRNPYPNITLRIASLLSLLLLIAPLSLFSQDSSPPSPDFNNDGIVDLADYDLFRSQWNTRAGGPNWDAKFDLHGDGVIDLWDYEIFRDNWGKTFPVNNGESSPQPATPQVTISAGTTPVTEGTDATFTLTASPAPSTAISVNVNISQSGSFVSGSVGTRTVSIGTSGTATLTVETQDDSADETNGSVIAQLRDGAGYTVGSSSSATVTVNDNDDPPPPSNPNPPPPPSNPNPPPPPSNPNPPPPPSNPNPNPPSNPPSNPGSSSNPTVTIAAGTSPITEGTDATFTLTASPRPSATISVGVDVSQNASFARSTGTKHVNIGTSGTGTLSVETVDDSRDENNGTITAQLRSGKFATPPYTVGSPSSASVTVNDNDDPSPGSIVPTPREPRLSLPSSVSFTITDGETATEGIAIRNDGNTGTMQVTSITTNVDGLSFNKTSFNVAAGSIESVTATFTSTTTGTRSGSITVVSSAGTGTISVSVTVNPIVTLATLTLKEDTSDENAKVTFYLTVSLARSDASLTVRVEKSGAGGIFWDGLVYNIVTGPHTHSYTHTFSNPGTTETVEIETKITQVHPTKSLGSLALEIHSPADHRRASPAIVSVAVSLQVVNLD